MQYAPNAIPRYTGETFTDYEHGFSGYNPNDPEKVSRNPDGSMLVSYITYRVYEVDLACGHVGRFYSTGWMSGSCPCPICEKVS
jgi:hypothetical protein